MTDTRTSRANTPRTRAPRRTSQASRRASSVPAVGSRRPEYVLDCVLMTPRKRKRTTSQDDLPSGSTQSQSSRLALAGGSKKRAPTRPTRSRARSTENEAPPSSRTRSRSQKRSSSPIAPIAAKTPRRRTASSSRSTDTNEYRTAPSPAQRRRAASRASLALGNSAPPSRASDVTASSRRNKGKARALPVDFETPSQRGGNADGSVDAESSTSGTRRGAKRRRVSPQLAPDAEDLSPTATVTEAEVDMDGAQTAVEEDFQMLDMPDDVSLPWVPMDPSSRESAYVPPGLNALIEDMKRALVLQISARQKAENMHAEELQRRRELEHEAARLAAANRALEAERSAWTTSAAEALASTLESALVADMSRRVAAETPPSASAFLEEVDEPQPQPHASATEASGAGPGLGLPLYSTGMGPHARDGHPQGGEAPTTSMQS
ncbi:hypothetical protein BD413DRAFT_629898 [Trametes elegans]|nr:hypothetical protein BD413DRAFT_629898 [Trametes elegans]